MWVEVGQGLILDWNICEVDIAPGFDVRGDVGFHCRPEVVVCEADVGFAVCVVT